MMLKVLSNNLRYMFSMRGEQTLQEKLQFFPYTWINERQILKRQAQDEEKELLKDVTAFACLINPREVHRVFPMMFDSSPPSNLSGKSLFQKHFLPKLTQIIKAVNSGQRVFINMKILYYLSKINQSLQLNGLNNEHLMRTGKLPQLCYLLGLSQKNPEFSQYFTKIETMFFNSQNQNQRIESAKILLSFEEIHSLYSDKLMQKIYSLFEKNIENMDYVQHIKIVQFSFKNKHSKNYLTALTNYCLANKYFQNVLLIRSIFKTRNSLQMQNQELKQYIINNFNSFKSPLRQRGSNKIQFLRNLSDNYKLPTQINVYLNEFLKEEYNKIQNEKPTLSSKMEIYEMTYRFFQNISNVQYIEMVIEKQLEKEENQPFYYWLCLLLFEFNRRDSYYQFKFVPQLNIAFQDLKAEYQKAQEKNNRMLISKIEQKIILLYHKTVNRGKEDKIQDFQFFDCSFQKVFKKELLIKYLFISVRSRKNFEIRKKQAQKFLPRVQYLLEKKKRIMYYEINIITKFIGQYTRGQDTKYIDLWTALEKYIIEIFLMNEFKISEKGIDQLKNAYFKISQHFPDFFEFLKKCQQDYENYNGYRQLLLKKKKY